MLGNMLESYIFKMLSNKFLFGNPSFDAAINSGLFFHKKYKLLSVACG